MDPGGLFPRLPAQAATELPRQNHTTDRAHAYQVLLVPPLSES